MIILPAFSSPSSPTYTRFVGNFVACLGRRFSFVRAVNFVNFQIPQKRSTSMTFRIILRFLDGVPLSGRLCPIWAAEARA